MYINQNFQNNKFESVQSFLTTNEIREGDATFNF